MIPAQKPRRDVEVGIAEKAITAAHAVTEGLTAGMVAKQTKMGAFTDDAAPASTGNLFEPMQDGWTISGGWRDKS